ncbi:hypothetical protein O6H91_14G027100 [Diphasiastrum complanatum]|uniref:Uncharacterized protein n=1 Tax=Diphasiastrum complanatum TaxID=34168 RepID=A0ACC2BMQ5_DIPCM|nr:hypothetical protein O6H91_14G027100 [Diphasiastrum complanatum]
MEDAKEIKAFQACNVLHGGPTKLEVLDDASSSGRRGSRKARRVNLLEVRKEQENKLTDLSACPCPKTQSASIQTLRMEAFDIVWANIEKDTLAAQHKYIFTKLQQWVCDRQFHDAQLKLYYANAGKASKIDSCNATRSWLRQSQSIGVSSNRIHTALLFVGAIDSSDSRAIFDDLTTYMKEHCCHVASLQPHNLSSKAVINGALRSLFKQFTQHNPDTTDMEILAAWHVENPNQTSPMVIIIEDAECCNSMVLAELIIVLSEWVTRLPLVLIMGMSTTCASLKKLLPSRALGCLHLQQFSLKSPTELLEAIFKAVLMESSGIFSLGHDVVEFLFKFFFTHDNSVSSLLKSMKIACMEHFCKEPLSFLCKNILQSSSQVEFEDCCNNLSKNLLEYAGNLASVKRQGESNQNVGKQLATMLWKVKMDKPIRRIVLLCLYEVGKYFGFSFADIYCEALCHRNLLDLMAPIHKDFMLESVILKIRDLPPTTFSAVLEEWKHLASHDDELNAEITSFQLKVANFPNYPDLEKNEKIDGIGQGGEKLAGSLASEIEGHRFLKKQTGYRSEFYVVKTMAAELLERLYRQHLIPPEALLFHEVFCFTDVNLLKQALTAETRKQIHADVLASHDYLHCTCCSPKHGLSSSMHDTSLLYSLSQGSDNIVNIHDCYQSFYMQFSAAQQQQPRKGRDKKSPKRKRDLSKKTAEMSEKLLELDKASIQARFAQSITELQIVGLFRMPTKKRPDHVQRVFSI